MNAATPRLSWESAQADGHTTQHATWRSLAGLPAPKRLVAVDDRTSADEAYHLACEGTYLVWQGDYHNGKQLLQALARRIDTPSKQNAKRSKAGLTGDKTERKVEFPLAFHQHRHKLAQRANVLNKLLLPMTSDFSIPLRRAPDVRAACAAAYGAQGFEAPSPEQTSGTPIPERTAITPFPERSRREADHANTDAVPLNLTPFREIIGLIGAYEWQKQGVAIPALQATIYPRYGVYSPVRGEYLDLIAQAPLPAALRSDSRAWDIGTGTGVIAALLAQRGVQHLIATDQDPRALACARDNLQRLGYAAQVQCVAANLFPSDGQRVPLIVCNPPWLPAKPSSAIEYAVYDPDSQMLKGFLAGLAEHLSDGGEGWLILSDIAEWLKLRSREELLAWIEAAGLKVIERHDIRPTHRKAFDREDPLHFARAREVTSLWRLSANH